MVKRAIKNKVLTVHVHNLRDYSVNKHKKVDDYAYGTNAGMVMSIDPIYRCVEFLKSKIDYQEVIYMAPDGELLNQSIVNELSLIENIIILCGHYKGVDERVRESLVTREVSIGNYVLSGGELPVCVLIDAVSRLLPGFMSDETSALSDSFQNGLVAPPVYTRPYKYRNMKVPDVLLSGNEQKIREWEYEQSVMRTRQRRSEFFKEKGDY